MDVVVVKGSGTKSDEILVISLGTTDQLYLFGIQRSCRTFQK